MGSDMSNSHALGGSGRSAQRGIMESNITNVGCETWHPLKIGKGQHESWSSIGANLGNGARRCSAEQHTEKKALLQVVQSTHRQGSSRMYKKVQEERAMWFDHRRFCTSCGGRPD